MPAQDIMEFRIWNIIGYARVCFQGHNMKDEMTQERESKMIVACHCTILSSIDAFCSMRLRLREYLLTVDVAEDILVTYLKGTFKSRVIIISDFTILLSCNRKCNTTETNNVHVFCFEDKVESSANGILQTVQRRGITPVAVVPKGRLATADAYRRERAN